MSLEEAIKHAEEVAEDQERNAGWFYDKERSCYRKKCIKCAEEHRQLAEWLRELKNLKERSISDDAINREDALMALTGEWTVSKDELIAKFVRRVKDLPSVTPKDDRQEVIDRIRKLQTYKLFSGGEKLVELDKVIAILEGREPE